MDSIEQKSGIELGRVSSSRSAHVSVPAAVKQEPDAIDGVGVSATTEYEFLTGFRLWSLIIAIMLSMLLLGLDINIVATVSVLCSHSSLPTTSAPFPRYLLVAIDKRTIRPFLLSPTHSTVPRILAGMAPPSSWLCKFPPNLMKQNTSSLLTYHPRSCALQPLAGKLFTYFPLKV
jgi:hypothetical protein